MIPSLDVVFALHDAAIEKSGGRPGIRDERLIDSAYYSAFQGFGDLEFYPTDSEKIIRIGWGLASNHGFVDGNKRVGIAFISFAFEGLLGASFSCSEEDLEEEMLRVAEGEEPYEFFRDWIYEHIVL